MTLTRSLSLSLDYFAVLPELRRSADISRLELFSHQPPVWCDQPLTYLDICTCDPRPRPMDYKPLQFSKARKSSEALLHSCELRVDVRVHEAAAVVPPGWYKVSALNRAGSQWVVSLSNVCFLRTNVYWTFCKPCAVLCGYAVKRVWGECEGCRLAGICLFCLTWKASDTSFISLFHRDWVLKIKLYNNRVLLNW